ncbi:MAG: rhodanese-like domain-containing protein [Bacteroidaceae bacterium]|nr:rhodanese-like domain-containing protein [Bacteroidaceae bacterium]MBR3916060.1 rhodanese-like domain-containing protein [Bacteroidaceae bacterium]
MKFGNLFLLFIVFSLESCTFSFEKKVEGEGEVHSVSVEAFADSISRPGVQLVDVRTPEEFNSGNIPGSVNIDVMTGHFGEEASGLLDKSRTVAVYCRSGNRSKNAAKMLSMMGYNVVELDSGYKAWQESGR